jgi:UDP-glucose 4-epimerase
MRVLVMGGTGLIGRATVQSLLEAGDDVSVASRSRPAGLPSGARWCPLDVSDAARVLEVTRDCAPDAVLHLAALLQFDCDRDPARAIRVNVDGTLHALEACRELGIARMVFGSSIAVYGPTHELMREDGWTFSGTGLYGVTKLMGEALGARYRAEHGIEFVALRYSGVFGPDEFAKEAPSAGMSAVRKRILECAKGREISIEGASGGEQIHLTHVLDAANATCLALRHPSPSFPVYNVAGPRENYVSLKGLYDAVRAIAPSAGRPLWKGAGKTAGPVDIGRIRQDLGFTPSVRLADGLRQMLIGQ